jgi:hypothetical protein
MESAKEKPLVGSHQSGALNFAGSRQETHGRNTDCN